MDFSLNAIIIFYMYSGDLVWVLYAEYIMRNTGLDEAQVEIEIAKRNVNNLKYTDLYVYYAYGRKQRRTKEPLGEIERGE